MTTPIGWAVLDKLNLGSTFVHLGMPPYHHVAPRGAVAGQEKAQGGTPAVQCFIMEGTEVVYAHIL